MSTWAASVARKTLHFGKEEILPGAGLGLDGANFVHEVRRLSYLLRRQRIRVIGRADHAVDVVDRTLGVLGLFQIDLGRRALVLVDAVDRFLERVIECLV